MHYYISLVIYNPKGFEEYEMSSCDECSSAGTCSDEKKEVCQVEINPRNHISRVIGVMSGKGGVGKSTVSVMMASALAEKGFKVGILDADITGPSIPRLMGVSGERMQSDGDNMLPVMAQNGVKVVSLNLILEEENKPVVWRGPIITNTVKQFWKDVLWGDLDYLLIDMPPGTSDVAMTVMQSVPLEGVVMVSVPQDMVSMIVTKAVKMAGMMETKVLGIVQNMSYIECPGCGERVQIFNSENTTEYLKELNLELLAELPMSPKLTSFGSAGISSADKTFNKLFEPAAARIVEICPV